MIPCNNLHRFTFSETMDEYNSFHNLVTKKAIYVHESSESYGGEYEDGFHLG
jgi:hypothetical protein